MEPHGEEPRNEAATELPQGVGAEVRGGAQGLQEEPDVRDGLFLPLNTRRLCQEAPCGSSLGQNQEADPSCSPQGLRD